MPSANHRFFNQQTIAVFGVIAIGSVLRMVDLGSKSFWTDELLSIWHAGDIMDVRSFLSSQQGNAHPPLYFLLLKLWMYGGSGEAYLRIPAVISGILVIPSTYLLGMQFFDHKTSLVGALLVAVSPFHILHDREVRMYSLFVLFTVVSLYFFIRALREDKTELWIGYTVFTVLNTYTHYHAFLVIFSEWLFFIIKFGSCRHLLKKALISQAFIVFCFLFWAPAFLIHFKSLSYLGAGISRFPAPIPLWIKPAYLFFSFSIGQTILPWNYSLVIPAMAVFITAMAEGIKNLISRNETLMFFILFLLLPVAAGIFITDTIPKYFIFITPLFSLIIANGISAIRPVRIQCLMILGILMIQTYSLKNYYSNEQFHIMASVDPWREVGSYLKNNVKEKDVLFNIGGVPVNYYSRFNAPVLRNDADKYIQKTLGEQMERPARIWLIVSDLALKKAGDDSVQWMNGHYSLISEKGFFRDPAFKKREEFFKRDFMEYRIKVYLYQ